MSGVYLEREVVRNCWFVLGFYCEAFLDHVHDNCLLCSRCDKSDNNNYCLIVEAVPIYKKSYIFEL